MFVFKGAKKNWIVEYVSNALNNETWGHVLHCAASPIPTHSFKHQYIWTMEKILLRRSSLQTKGIIRPFQSNGKHATFSVDDFYRLVLFTQMQKLHYRFLNQFTDKSEALPSYFSVFPLKSWSMRSQCRCCLYNKSMAK